MHATDTQNGTDSIDDFDIICDGYELTDADTTGRLKVDPEWWRSTGSKRLGEMKENVDMTDAEIAEIIGYSSDTVNNSRNGHTTPSPKLMAEYETLFGEGSFGDVEYVVEFSGVTECR